jgi:hypothetical protein
VHWTALVSAEVRSYNQGGAGPEPATPGKDSFARNRKLTGITPDGFAATSPGRGPEFGESSVANPNQPRTSSDSLEADRLRVIEKRLQDHFYEVPPASEQIAASVLADLRNPEQSASTLPR